MKPMSNPSATIWREQEFMTMTAAAAVLGVSPNWVHDAICSRRLEARRLKPGGRPMVVVRSLAALVDRALPVAATDLPKPRAAAKLRLVISNP